MSGKRIAVVLWIFVCSAGIAMAQTEWVIDAGPLLEPGSPGSFDAGGGWPGTVVFDGSSYHLYYVGFPEPDGPFFQGWQIGHATSPDGLIWTKDAANPVVGLGSAGEWDERSLSKPAVEFDGSMFHMWYVGGNTSVASAGYATSLDGSMWTKHGENPVLEPGPPGSWEGEILAPHTVLFNGSTYRMWYYAGPSVGPWQIGYAESSDGLSWTKHTTPVLSPGPPGSWDSWSPHEPALVIDGGVFHMWYTASTGSVADLSIGYARSDDGINWTKHVPRPVVTHDPYAISSTVLLEDGTYRMWFAAGSDIYHATSTEDEFMSSLQFIPAAAFASGAQGSFYQTDVDLNNAGSQPVEYTFMWLPRGENNSDPVTSETFTLGAGMSVRYSNVLAEVFGLEPNALGAFSMLSSSPDLLCMSRTYNLESVKSGGTFGQAIPAIKPGEFIERGERRRILFGSQGEDYRTNVGCVNGTGERGAVEVELFNSEGVSLKTERLWLDPWSNDQLNALFSDYAPVEGYVDVWTMLPNGNFYCYGSVLDNVTSDPTTILPQ